MLCSLKYAVFVSWWLPTNVHHVSSPCPAQCLQVAIVNSTFHNNDLGDGFLLTLSAGNYSILNSDFENNTALINGGSVAILTSNANIFSCRSA